MLDTARQQASMTLAGLWVAYLAVGGTATPTEMGSFLSGATEPDPDNYNLVAQAINEHFTRVGMDHPVPYFDELV
jgi:hypothetical protein